MCDCPCTSFHAQNKQGIERPVWPHSQVQKGQLDAGGWGSTSLEGGGGASALPSGHCLFSLLFPVVSLKTSATERLGAWRHPVLGLPSFSPQWWWECEPFMLSPGLFQGSREQEQPRSTSCYGSVRHQEGLPLFSITTRPCPVVPVPSSPCSAGSPVQDHIPSSKSTLHWPSSPALGWKPHLPLSVTVLPTAL